MDDNKYELLDDDARNNVAATKKIDKAIEQFTKRLVQISKQYPDVGMGDTATDEAIVSEVYSEIHSAL